MTIKDTKLYTDFLSEDGPDLENLPISSKKIYFNFFPQMKNTEKWPSSGAWDFSHETFHIWGFYMTWGSFAAG
jgi:hypothetical protein